MNSEIRLRRHLSPLGVWAFSIGTSIGWGSLVVTASTYLAQAGPMGSVLGLAAGALIMLLIARCYAYMMSCYPESGGAYAFSREAFGYDQGFLTAWFLALTYLAILWANATSLPLFSRIFLGGVFHFGKLYTVFGYDVYLGEALLTAAAIVLVALLCTRCGRAMTVLMIVLACLFTAGIAICYFGALAGGAIHLEPKYLPDSSALSQLVHIAVISPWAFIGFESVSHATEEFSFEHRMIRRLLIVSVLSTTALYILVILLSVTAHPVQYDSWLAYIRDLDRLSGLEALPAFYAADHYLGGFGVLLLTLSLLSLVVTSLIGNTAALSRLFYSLAKDRLLPGRFARLNAQGVPADAVLLVAAASLPITLIGRTAIGWIVDVTTIGATLIYGFVAAAAARTARRSEDWREMWIGRVTLGVMCAFGAYIMLPNLLWRSSLSRETYFLIVVWCVLGFLYLRAILRRDKERRFGNSSIVWVALLALVLFTSLIWMRQTMIAANDVMEDNVARYYEQVVGTDPARADDMEYIEQQLFELEQSNARTILLAVGMFSLALFVMLSNHSYLTKRSRESEALVNIDPMTGVKNKHAFMVQEGKLDEAIGSAHAGEFAIAVCDVNGLKKINDTYGHKTGDEYIRAACMMVCEIFQHSPVYRIGGDEFVVLLNGKDYAIRRQLMTALHDRSIEHIGRGGAVVSGGLADFDPAVDHSAHEVFERADAQMYEEKKLLKAHGAEVRDDSEETAKLFAEMGGTPSIINVRKQVLIADDEEINRQILGTVLEEGYELIYAADGIEALDVLRDHHEQLALVLLDLMMPRMSGIEVLKIMQETPEFKSIPVVVLTADQQAEVECLKLGAMEFIPKPYPAWEIVQARVNKCIELAEDRDIIQSTERDNLTHLFNLDYFLRYVKIFDQHYWDMPMDAIVVDVNHFHLINERYGKSYGDAVLRRLGEGIRKLAREIGGVGCHQVADTFLLYCPNRGNYERMLERIAEGLTEEEIASNRIRLRMGVYASADKTLEIERRFDRAKLAADTAKDNYLRPIGIYDAKMHESALFHERLLEDFHSSIEERRFSVLFQPKFDIRPAKPILASAEALVRWKHPTLGMISPGVFIPLLEENGLILELDKYVWNETAATIRSWKERFGFSVPVSVNVSRIDMLMPNLKSIFREILDQYGLSTKDIILEITESAYTGDSDQVISMAHELRGMDMGFHIEMDDFGTGYSSLGMLTHLPIDALKLDMTFIRSAFGETRDVRMIELIIDIADYLHVPVVAEGVETEEQYLTLKAMGCDLVQGYYFSRPVPAQEFERFLTARGERSVELTPEVHKSYLSISRALTSNFESIWYVDTLTDFYLEFRSGEDGEMVITRGGASFFADVEEKLFSTVCPEDEAMLRGALTKEHLMDWIGKDEAVRLFFRRQDGRTYTLQTIRTRSSDRQHIVLGVKAE